MYNIKGYHLTNLKYTEIIGLVVIFILFPILFNSYYPDSLDDNLLKDHLVADSLWFQKFANNLIEENLKTNEVSNYITASNETILSENAPLPFIPVAILSIVTKISSNNLFTFFVFFFNR